MIYENYIDTVLLSLIVFLPTVGAVLLSFLPGKAEALIKQVSFVTTVITFILTVILLVEFMKAGAYNQPLAERAAASDVIAGEADKHDFVFRHPWITFFKVDYYMGVDGISLPLVLLTGLISMISMIAAWTIKKQIKGFCILFLLLETGMMGTFLSLDFFLFYVFWEVMLFPMYFLIGLWGAPTRTEPDGRVRGGPYAAIKFFIFTLFGSVLMLVALIGLYFYEVNGVRTFDLMKLQANGMSGAYTKTFQIVMFILLYIGFAIKVPLFPFHTWLPDAHVEAPTPISMILAGVLLKLGGYGLIRIAYPICPEAALALAWPLAGIGVINIIYGAFAAMAQTDFKKLVAYSSISHMGYVMLGLAVWPVLARTDVANAAQMNDVWAIGVNGAMFQMIAHGISSAGMFFMVGVIYERVHHRDLNRFGGLATEMPVYGGLSAIIFFAGLGLPGLCGFIGEAMTVLASWQFSKTLAVIAALGVILTAGYILWTLQRVYFGTKTEGLGSHPLHDLTVRELACAIPLLLLAIALGVYPDFIFSFMEPSVTELVGNMAKFVASN